jgi:hypothetical protein
LVKIPEERGRSSRASGENLESEKRTEGNHTGIRRGVKRRNLLKGGNRKAGV